MVEDNDLKERQRLYERTRDDLAASVRSVSESLDRSLLTLSSAFLGGSLAFIGQIVELPSARGIFFLYGSWVLFALTIVLTIASFIYGIHGFRVLSDAARRYYMEGQSAAWKISDQRQRGVILFSDACGVSFILGIVLLIVFASINLDKSRATMTPERIQKSVPPGTFQEPVTPSPASPGGTSQPATTPVNPGGPAQPATTPGNPSGTSKAATPATQPVQ